MTRPLRVYLVWLGMLAAWLPGPSALAAPKAHAVARLKDGNGKPVGTADFTSLGNGVLILFDLQNLPPGPHGIHLHTSGNCDAPSGFTKAGPILSLAPGKVHGYLAQKGPLAGDLPNQFAGADGRLKASTVSTAFNLGNGKKSIFDRDGAAIIVTQRGDDYRTAPLGNGGARIACGVVVRTTHPAARRAPKGPARPKKA